MKRRRRRSESPELTNAKQKELNEAQKASDSIAVDGGSASSKTIPCYTVDRFKRELNVASGNRVQLNMRVDKYLRDRFNELAKRFGASTCEFEEALILSLDAADRGIEAFLVVTPKLNLVVQTYVMRMVKKRRRRFSQDFDAVEVLPIHGEYGVCSDCGSRYGVNKWSGHEALVYLCFSCAKDWLRNGRLRVMS